MSTILAIETSAEIASVALLYKDVLFTRESSGVATHSQTILPMVQAVLADAGISLRDCDAIAYGAGPGSFTGVRTACGVAQGLAYGLQLPVLPVVTLQALAQACYEQSEEECQTKDVLTVIDARMGEVYWAQYRGGDDWQTITEPTLSAAVEVRAEGEVTVCGNGLTAYADDFSANSIQLRMPTLMPHARQIAVLGARAFARGESITASVAEPLYLRNKIALTTIERAEKNAKEVA